MSICHVRAVTENLAVHAHNRTLLSTGKYVPRRYRSSLSQNRVSVHQLCYCRILLHICKYSTAGYTTGVYAENFSFLPHFPLPPFIRPCVSNSHIKSQNCCEWSPHACIRLTVRTESNVGNHFCFFLRFSKEGKSQEPCLCPAIAPCQGQDRRKQLCP